MHGDGEHLGVHASFLQARQIHVVRGVAREEVVALVEHRLGDVAVRIDDDGVEMEPPVVGSDPGTFARGTGQTKQGERGSPHAHTFAEIWQGEEPSLVFRV